MPWESAADAAEGMSNRALGNVRSCRHRFEALPTYGHVRATISRLTPRPKQLARLPYIRLAWRPGHAHPLDCLAPALLSGQLNYRQVVPLFQPSGPCAEVLSAMRAVLALANDPELDFLALDLDDSDGPWAVIDAAVVASGDAGGVGVDHLKAVAVTKILHRKPPALVPLFDSRVYNFYFDEEPAVGAYKATPRRFWPVLQADLVANRPMVAQLAATVRTPDDRALSVLRAADIVIWEHQATGCRRAR
jgi:hypothetical protein